MLAVWVWDLASIQAVGAVVFGAGTLAVVIWATRVARSQKGVSESALKVAAQQAEASFRLAKSQIRPVLQLSCQFQQVLNRGDQIILRAENFGDGSAINLKVWLDCHEFPDVCHRDFRLTEMILRPEKQTQVIVSQKPYHGENGAFDPGAGNLPTNADGLWACAQYENIDGDLFETKTPIFPGDPFKLWSSHSEIDPSEDQRITQMRFERNNGESRDQVISEDSPQVRDLNLAKDSFGQLGLIAFVGLGLSLIGLITSGNSAADSRFVPDFLEVRLPQVGYAPLGIIFLDSSLLSFSAALAAMVFRRVGYIITRCQPIVDWSLTVLRIVTIGGVIISWLAMQRILPSGLVGLLFFWGGFMAMVLAIIVVAADAPPWREQRSRISAFGRKGIE